MSFCGKTPCHQLATGLPPGLFGSPLPEARDYARMILEELKAVVPSFVARVERPDRGGEWIAYLEERERAGERWAARLGLEPDLVLVSLFPDNDFSNDTYELNYRVASGREPSSWM